jgi:hypothetical protein
VGFAERIRKARGEVESGGESDDSQGEGGDKEGGEGSNSSHSEGSDDDSEEINV